mmetsp:Transcript_27207/g.50154  ORF Transcript_27207/g.50154 Transcript_27207/m.50154 type:complete len:454 (-) Transcript_27207:376-1737(-)|eukprot:CAMPEP_0175048978 /NCGR_PEP_ID=MMETSP0052_2-20121109/6489_1 /TAXON_ID=51329 ORGANISM="Polytomella parva, Strain SAG 63-3" /NCGR_SAMPLE_ID=MMETSP0052_2 /ASSEMBLY_ACC=CAM_ASM_000194 /LENGTH=453 /DNA_ID=CAMNT_0016313101 /DNA_START=723 /DNA_END=2084 /DNA_ORIENTATION=-
MKPLSLLLLSLFVCPPSFPSFLLSPSPIHYLSPREHSLHYPFHSDRDARDALWIAELNRGVFDSNLGNVLLESLENHVRVRTAADVDMRRQHGNAHADVPDVQVMHVQHARHFFQGLGNLRDLEVAGGSLHEGVGDVLQNGHGGVHDEKRENEGADGVGNQPARVVLVIPDQSTCHGDTNTLQEISNHVHDGSTHIQVVMLMSILVVVMIMIVVARIVMVVIVAVMDGDADLHLLSALGRRDGVAAADTSGRGGAVGVGVTLALSGAAGFVFVFGLVLVVMIMIVVVIMVVIMVMVMVMIVIVVISILMLVSIFMLVSILMFVFMIMLVSILMFVFMIMFVIAFAVIMLSGSRSSRGRGNCDCGFRGLLSMAVAMATAVAIIMTMTMVVTVAMMMVAFFTKHKGNNKIEENTGASNQAHQFSIDSNRINNPLNCFIHKSSSNTPDSKYRNQGS